MYRDKPKIDRASIECTTHAVASYVRALIERAEAMKADRFRKSRLEFSECVYCYAPYGAGRQGGTKTTQLECGLCSTIIHSNNTNCDVLCVECARKNCLCKHCGADVDLKVRRKKRAFEEVENNGDSPTGEGTRS